MLYFYLLKGQLHIFFVIIVIKIVAAIMHSHKVHKADIVVQRFMFYKMADKGREFQDLIQRSGIKDYDRQDDM